MTETTFKKIIIKESIRIAILFLLCICAVLFFSGSKTLKTYEYIFPTGNKTFLVVGVWYVITGVFLLLSQIFFFIREWYHKFRRELMNVISIFISFFLLFYISFSYFSLTGFQNSLYLIHKEASLSFNENSSFSIMKAILLMFAIWSLVGIYILLKKVIRALRHSPPVV